MVNKIIIVYLVFIKLLRSNVILYADWTMDWVLYAVLKKDYDAVQKLLHPPSTPRIHKRRGIRLGG